MKKLMILAVALLTLTACDPKIDDVGRAPNNSGAAWVDYTSNYIFPPEMQGCKVFYLKRADSSGLPSLTTIYCPSGNVVSVEYPSGKSKTQVLMGKL